MRYVQVAEGQQTFASVASVGGVTTGCGPGGFPAGTYFLQFTSTPPGNAGETRVWIDDSIAGMSYDTTSGLAVITKFGGVGGTRHLVLRASNATRSATWDIFYQGAGATCKISIEMPAAASSPSAASLKRVSVGSRVVRPAARGRKGR